MNIKGFIGAVMYGAAATLGSILMVKGIEHMRDPVKRAKVKNGFENIKDAFTNKTES